MIEELAAVTMRTPLDFRGLSNEALLALLRLIQNGSFNPVAQKARTATSWLREVGIGLSDLSALRSLGWLEGELPPSPAASSRLTLQQRAIVVERSEVSVGRERSQGNVRMAGRKLLGKKKARGITR